MDYAIKLAKELLTPKYLMNMTREEKKAELLKGMHLSTEFETYCYEHNFHPQRIKDMAREELEENIQEWYYVGL